MSRPLNEIVPDDLRRRQQARERFDQLGLPVAFHARHADDFAGAHVERHVIQAPRTIMAADGEIAHAQHDRAAASPAASRRGAALRVRPSAGRARRRVVSLVLTLSDDTPIAHDGHVIRDREHLRQLVRDDDDGLP